MRHQNRVAQESCSGELVQPRSRATGMSCSNEIVLQRNHTLVESYYRGVTQQRSRATKQKGCTAEESDNSGVLLRHGRAAGDPGSSTAVQQQNGAAAESCNKGVGQQRSPAAGKPCSIAHTQNCRYATGESRSRAYVQQRCCTRAGGSINDEGVQQQRHAAVTLNSSRVVQQRNRSKQCCDEIDHRNSRKAESRVNAVIQQRNCETRTPSSSATVQQWGHTPESYSRGTVQQQREIVD